MTDDALDMMVMYAPAGDLIRALAMRGATTKRLAGNVLRVTLKVKMEDAQPTRVRRRRAQSVPDLIGEGRLL
jgi:hypothetical protein